MLAEWSRYPNRFGRALAYGQQAERTTDVLLGMREFKKRKLAGLGGIWDDAPFNAIIFSIFLRIRLTTHTERALAS